MKSVIKCGTVVLGLALAVMSCSRERQPPPKATPETPATSEKSTTDQPAPDKPGGAIFGKVIFRGKWQPRTVPVSKDQEVCGKSKPDPTLVLSPQGEVLNAVVYIKTVQGTKKLEPGKATLDQKGCEYRPHVLAFLAGSTLEILNPDGILHNVHAESKVNSPFNLAQPKFKTILEVKVEKPEIRRRHA
jgi:hypothetical protein